MKENESISSYLIFRTFASKSRETALHGASGSGGAGGGKRLKAPKGRQHHPFALKLYLCGTFFAAGKSLSRFFLNNPSVHMGKTVL
jgi:hypothetical protein